MSTTHHSSFDQYCISHKTISYRAAAAPGTEVHRECPMTISISAPNAPSRNKYSRPRRHWCLHTVACIRRLPPQAPLYLADELHTVADIDTRRHRRSASIRRYSLYRQCATPRLAIALISGRGLASVTSSTSLSSGGVSNQSFFCDILARTVSDNSALLCSFSVSCLTPNASFLL